jgi:hypothetical protein
MHEHVVCMEEMHTNLNRRDNLKDLGIDRILEWILRGSCGLDSSG